MEWIVEAETLSDFIDHGRYTISSKPIIRCKDCLYGYRYYDTINGKTDTWVECRNPDGLNRDTSEDNFCSCGERKDD